MDALALKNSILQLAIQGKLVPQLASEPEVEQLGEAPTEVPFEIPKKWKWMKLGDITLFENGDRSSNYPSKDKLSQDKNSNPFVSALNMDNGRISDDKLLYLSDEQYKALRSGKIKKGDILLCIRGSLGKFAEAAADGGAIASSLVIIRVSEMLMKNYLRCFLESSLLYKQIEQQKNGTAQPNLGAKVVSTFLIPLPPLAEQKRIVAKLEELMPLCEEYGREEKKLKVLTAALPDKLKASVLQQAIAGKLVPQLASEPEVEQLGEAPAEVPFEIPKKWKWVRLTGIGKVVSGGTPKTHESSYWVKTFCNNDSCTSIPIPWITPADLGKNKGNKKIATGAKFISKYGLEHSSATLMPEGSIIYSSRAPIGHIAIAAQKLSTNQGCKSLIPNLKIVLSDWIYYALINRTDDIILRASGTTFKEISAKGFGETYIPIPPLTEQKRIVAKLEEIFKAIDEITPTPQETRPDKTIPNLESA